MFFYVFVLNNNMINYSVKTHYKDTKFFIKSQVFEHVFFIVFFVFWRAWKMS